MKFGRPFARLSQFRLPVLDALPRLTFPRLSTWGAGPAGSVPLGFKLVVVNVMMLVAGGTLVTFGTADAQTAAAPQAASHVPAGTEVSPRVESEPIVAPLTTDPLASELAGMGAIASNALNGATTVPELASSDEFSSIGDDADSDDDSDDDSKGDDDKSKKNKKHKAERKIAKAKVGATPEKKHKNKKKNKDKKKS